MYKIRLTVNYHWTSLISDDSVMFAKKKSQPWLRELRHESSDELRCIYFTSKTFCSSLNWHNKLWYVLRRVPLPPPISMIINNNIFYVFSPNDWARLELYGSSFAIRIKTFTFASLGAAQRLFLFPFLCAQLRINIKRRPEHIKYVIQWEIVESRQPRERQPTDGPTSTTRTQDTGISYIKLHTLGVLKISLPYTRPIFTRSCAAVNALVCVCAGARLISSDSRQPRTSRQRASQRIIIIIAALRIYTS